MNQFIVAKNFNIDEEVIINLSNVTKVVPRRNRTTCYVYFNDATYVEIEVAFEDFKQTLEKLMGVHI